jgi:hypothetical protein
VFEREDEVSDLLQVIQAFGPPDGDRTHPNPNERSE